MDESLKPTREQILSESDFAIINSWVAVYVFQAQDLTNPPNYSQDACLSFSIFKRMSEIGCFTFEAELLFQLDIYNSRGEPTRDISYDMVLREFTTRFKPIHACRAALLCLLDTSPESEKAFIVSIDPNKKPYRVPLPLESVQEDLDGDSDICFIDRYMHDRRHDGKH